jgi:DNA-binding NarL/FixJ family response regulator
MKLPNVDDLAALLAGSPLAPSLWEDINAWFWAQVDARSEGCWPWSGQTDEDGYGKFAICGPGRVVHMRAHRFAWLLVHRSLPAWPLVVRHKTCGNPLCCRPAHLDVGTLKDNADDRERHGRTARGERSGRRLHPELWPRGERHPDAKTNAAAVGTARLTREKVVQMRLLRAQGWPYRQLAVSFGVCEASVRAVVTGKAWSHVDGPLTPLSGPAQGEENKSARLTAAQVRDVVLLRAQGWTQEAIAHKLGTKQSTISNILCGKTWRHVTEPLAKDAAARAQSDQEGVA